MWTSTFSANFARCVPPLGKRRLGIFLSQNQSISWFTFVDACLPTDSPEHVLRQPRVADTPGSCFTTPLCWHPEKRRWGWACRRCYFTTYPQVLFCRLTSYQRRLYGEFLESTEVKSVLSRTMRAFRAIGILRKLCNHPDLVCRFGDSVVTR